MSTTPPETPPRRRRSRTAGREPGPSGRTASREGQVGRTRAERTHRALLDAAWARLARGDVARLEDVAADAGVTRQALYLHFPSRGRLLVELVDHIDRELGLLDLLAEARTADGPAELLLAELRVTARYAPKIHAVAMSLWRLADTDAEAAEALADRMKRRRVGLRETLTAVEAAGLLAPDWTVKSATDALWAAGAPASVDLLLRERGWPAAQLERWLVHLGRSMLRPRGTAGR